MSKVRVKISYSVGKRQFGQLMQRMEANTVSRHPRQEVAAALLVAPLLEEAIFRAAFFRLANSRPAARTLVALTSATLFGLTHLRFGPRFSAYAFIGGLVLWATYARTGYWGAVLVHVAANLLDLSFGLRRYLALPFPR
jgi:membrane protease YdiL (CAAX protease family)